MRSRVWGRRNKGEKDLNKSELQEVKKMEPNQKDDFAILKQYNTPAYKLNIHKWSKMSVPRSQIVVKQIVARLEKKGHLNLKKGAKVGEKATDLRYDTSLLTNRGFGYYNELEKLDQASAIVMWAIIATIAAIVSAGFAVFVWLVSTGRIRLS